MVSWTGGDTRRLRPSLTHVVLPLVTVSGDEADDVVLSHVPFRAFDRNRLRASRRTPETRSVRLNSAGMRFSLNRRTDARCPMLELCDKLDVAAAVIADEINVARWAVPTRQRKRFLYRCTSIRAQPGK